jgi:hypothetical protein
VRAVALAVGLVLVATGCGDDGAEAEGPPSAEDAGAPERPPDLEGEVTRASGGGGRTDVLVDGAPGTQGTDRISFAVTDRTRVLHQQGDELVDVAVEHLVVGSRVRAWALDGRVAESYPAQAQAEAIVITGP